MSKMKDLDRKQINTIGRLKNRRNIIVTDSKEELFKN